MHLILCIDDKGGMLFHRRRQSQDREVRADMLRTAGDRPLWMNAYSRAQFPGGDYPSIRTAEDFLDRAGAGEYCFAEAGPVRPWLDRAESLILYRWNRSYPSDQKLDLVPGEEGWALSVSRDFPGYSHETITKEVYIR